MQKFSIHDDIKLKYLFKEKGVKPFRYAQIENAIYKNFIDKFNEIETIPKDLRNILEENCFYTSLIVDSEKTSSNGQTTKILFKTEKNEFIEAVIMRHLSGRVTLCVSCQVGCPMACSFCATGKMGLKRNLEIHEIIDQIMYAAKLLNREGDILRNVVYMGMGEPFLNYENVKNSIENIVSQKKLNLANRRITVSTCGIIPGIKKFTSDFPQVSLAISLHAPNDKLRSTIMPVNNKYPLQELMKSLDKHVKLTNKKIFYEYVMIAGINDDIKLAHELGKLLEGKLAHVNFIPYNSGEGIGGENYLSTSRNIIEKFQSILQHYGVVSTIRATMGNDIDAACGQLANKKE